MPIFHDPRFGRVVLAGAIALILIVAVADRGGLRRLLLAWYALLSTPEAVLGNPLGALARGLGVPVLPALLLGLLGALSPCQLSTNATALAYVARATGDGRRLMRTSLAYAAGKILVYSLAGLLIVIVGGQAAQASIPVVIVARKALGPLMLFAGLVMLRLVPFKLSFGQRFGAPLRRRAPNAGLTGAFLLGSVLAFAFCPTLFLLFFGLTIPLALSSPAGVFYPAAFAVGMVLPLLSLAVLLGNGFGMGTTVPHQTRRLATWLQPAAAVVFLLAGLNDTLIYWLL